MNMFWSIQQQRLPGSGVSAITLLPRMRTSGSSSVVPQQDHPAGR
jgi:hypothetical protein